jgi:hypothetical protein
VLNTRSTPWKLFLFRRIKGRNGKDVYSAPWKTMMTACAPKCTESQ